MSSNEEDYNDADNYSAGGLKKRRIQRACDICRRKKIRCDGVQMPGNRCSNCVSYSLDCTYVEASKKRGPPKGYVESLENRVEKLDKLLRKLLPDATLFKELQDAIDKERTLLNPSPLVATQQSAIVYHTSPGNPNDPLSAAIRGASDNTTVANDLVDDNADISILTDNLKQMNLAASQYRFLGKSSGARLIQAAVELKKEYNQLTQNPGPSRTEVWSPPDHWEVDSGTYLSTTYPHQYVFPEDDLASDLVDLYFTNINLYLPLLHRPIFEKSVAEGLHHTDERFASTYLLVCAVGARFSDDPRAKLDGVDSYHSCGLKWFNQVQIVNKSFLSPPTLYDLQFYCLSVHFLQGSAVPQSCWTMVGIGIRLAQDVGANRRRNTLTAEDEQWKRAFWVLVCLDRMISTALGRPCAIHDEDFDVDLPVDCDDEYWDNPDPEQRFKQPENKPSLTSAFLLTIKLHQILSYCLRTIYVINKSKTLLGYAGQQWEQNTVAYLDSELNKWVDSVPDHLRWDPNREDDRFFNQSASLYAFYYYIQILIHCPFIPSSTKPSSLSFPSLAICTNASRSCSHIAERLRKRNPLPPLSTSMAVFSAGIVLLLNIWGGKRSGLSVDPYKEMADVHKCMKFLTALEKRWRSVGRLSDILSELASVGELPLPQPSPMAVNKRERDSDTPISHASSESPQPMPQDEDGPRAISSSRRVKKNPSGSGKSKRAGQTRHQPNHPQWHLPPLPTPSASTSQLRQPSHSRQYPDRSMESALPYTLPVYSEDLGRLPLHGQLDFSTPSYVDQTNYWYQNIPNTGGSGSGIVEGNANSDHILSSSSSLSHHPNHSQQQHVPPSHNNPYPHSTTETSTITQGFPTTGTGNMIFDPMSLTYVPSSSYVGASSSMDIVSPPNPVGAGERPSHPNFQGVSVAMRGDLGGVVDRRQDSSQLPPHLEQPHHQQSQREHDIHGSHHHREQQQQQPMAHSYADNDTMAMWSNVPIGFELDEWATYLSNMSELGRHAVGGQHVQQ